jgi:type IV pilus assembly protein PilM
VPSTAVGIDIGSRTITVAETKVGRSATTVTNFGGVELPQDAVREGEILDVQAVSSALKELVGTAKVKSKKVWLGVANQRVVVRQIDLPWMDEKERADSLRYQVQEYIPIPVEEAEIDVHVVSDYETEGGEHFQRLLLVAAHKDMIASHVQAATDAGLDPIGVDLNPFAVLRAMGTTSPLESGNEVLVDVGAGVTNIVVHEAGTPTFVRILVMGGDEITEALTAGLGLSHEEAEARKREAAPSAEGDVAARIIHEQIGTFCDEIRNSLDYYQAQTGSQRLAGVMLTGGGSLLAGLNERLAATLRLPVEVGSPFDRWQVADTVYGPEDLARVGPSLATAVGLALGGLE